MDGRGSDATLSSNSNVSSDATMSRRVLVVLDPLPLLPPWTVVSEL